MNGEWGIFVPVAAADAGAAAAEVAAVAADGGEAAAAGGEAEAGEEGETEVEGTFNTAIATPAGNQKTDILFTANVSTILPKTQPGLPAILTSTQEAGNLEVEVNATAANAVAVVNSNPTGNPPAGFLFVDPQSFIISTESATAATDVVKVDYIFSAAILAAVDPTQGRIGKLDAATNEYVVDGVGEFEFEVEENEWSLTVPDLNGEWAILIPQAAVL